MQKQPSRGTLMKTCPEKYHQIKSTGEHPRRCKTPKKPPCSLFTSHSNAGAPPQTNPPLPYPTSHPPAKKKKNSLQKSTPKELHPRIIKNPS